MLKLKLVKITYYFTNTCYIRYLNTAQAFSQQEVPNNYFEYVYNLNFHNWVT